MASLEQFLQSGQLGSLSFGMTADEVTRTIGPAQDESVKKNPLVRKYGGLQLTFKADKGDPTRRLTHIGLYFSPQGESLPNSVRPTDWLPGPATTVAEFRAFLVKHNLSVYGAVEGMENHLVLSTGARVTFSEGGLESIQFVNRRLGQTVSIAIPNEILFAVREKANRSNRTVPELCAEWIAEKVQAQ